MTLLIKNVRVVYPDRTDDDCSDVLVSGDAISAIGRFPLKRADAVIDGAGVYLVPGFIDVQTYADRSLALFTNPDLPYYVTQGVTTIIGGGGGVSLTPLLSESTELIREWGDSRAVNLDWHTYGELAAVLRRQKIGVNFATLVGHASLHRAIVADDAHALCKDELGRLEYLLRNALDAGVRGVSLDLTSSCYCSASPKEQALLERVVSDHGGVYAVDVGDVGDVEGAVRAVVRNAKKRKGVTLVGNLTPRKRGSDAAKKAVEVAERAARNAAVHFDLSVHDASLVPLSSFLPVALRREPHATVLDILASRRKRIGLLEALPRVSPDRCRISWAIGQGMLEGKTLRDIMGWYETKDVRVALLQLMLATQLKALVNYENIDARAAASMRLLPRALIASRMPGIGADGAPFPQFIAVATRKGKVLLHEAVGKVTRVPARLFGLKRRGTIGEGYIADLVGFKDGEVRFVVVNGKVACEDGKVCEGVRAGKVL